MLHILWGPDGELRPASYNQLDWVGGPYGNFCLGSQEDAIIANPEEDSNLPKFPGHWFLAISADLFWHSA